MFVVNSKNKINIMTLSQLSDYKNKNNKTILMFIKFVNNLLFNC